MIIQFFRVLEGAVVFSINGGEDVILASGGTIQVPYPNLYTIKNISERVASLFFVMTAPSVDEVYEINAKPVRRAYYDKNNKNLQKKKTNDA